MKKLVFSIQVFIVTLLAAQLTSCEGFPGPEPISEQYARPEQVIVPGVPVVKGDGKSIYQPTSSRDFRYAAAAGDGFMNIPDGDSVEDEGLPFN